MGIAMTIPQVSHVWTTRKVDGLSLVTWISYSVFALFWMYYGFLHREKPVVIGNAVGLLLNILIVSAILLFR